MSSLIHSRRTALVAALCVAAATLLGLACDPAIDTSPPLVAGDAGRAVVHGASRDDAGVTSDSQVLDYLITDSDTEVTRARAAAAKTSSDAVTEFATLMITEHGRAADRLRELGRRKGIATASSGEGLALREDDEAIREKLAARKGASFDRSYLEEEIVTHLKTMSVLEGRVEAAAHDPELAAAVKEVHDGAIAHRERAQELLRVVRQDAGEPAPESTSESDVTSSSTDGGSPHAGLSH
jgi:putative membrane protein